MKARSFFGGLSLLLFLNLLIKPAWIFLVDRQVQNQVGHEAYGIYFSLFNLTYVLLFAADAGLTNLLVQHLASSQAQNGGSFVRTKVLLLLFYALLCLLIGWLGGVADWSLFLGLVAVQGLGSAYLFLRSLLSAQQLFSVDALFSVLDKTLLVLVCLPPLYGWIGRVSLSLFLQLQFLATGTAVTALVVLCLRRKLLRFSAPPLPFAQLTAQLLPFAAVILLMAAHYRLDGFLLQRLHPDGARQAGIYAAAYRLLDAANMPGYLCASFLVPFLARHQTDAQLRNRVTLAVRHGLLWVAATATTIVWIYAPWLQALLYNHHDAFADDVLRYCFAVLPAYGLVHVYGSVFTAHGRFKPFLAILLFCVVLNVAGNLLLIPRYGAMGSCIAALASQYTCGILLWWAVTRQGLAPAAIRPALLTAGWAVVCAVLFWLALEPGNTVWAILAGVGLLAVSAIVVQKTVVKQLLTSLNS